MIRIEKLVKRFGSKVLLAEASYHFPAGERVALVGDNGTGKSTLLNIITGLEANDGGEVIRPAQLTLGYLPQEPNPEPAASVLAECKAGARRLLDLEESMQAALTALEQDDSTDNIAAYEKAETAYRLAGGYAVGARASAILRGLGFRDEQHATYPGTLSGGWRMRLELAKLFMQEPDFLILDEPTNHLDLPSLVWVEKYLLNFRGSLLFVSHDRDLLNRLATVTLHLERGRLTPYKGNFDAFMGLAAARRAQESAQAEQLQKRRQGLEEFVTRFGAKATKAKQAASKMKMIERIAAEEEGLHSEVNNEAIHFSLPPPSRADRLVYHIQAGAIGYAPGASLSVGITLQVERGQKIAIIGANGIGKSTLLKTMVGRLPPLAGDFVPAAKTEIAYFSQDQLDVLHAEKSVLENILAQSDLGQAEARSILGGFLFRGEDVFKVTRVLSGGEKSRLGLACVLAQKANFLLLDEPTNHLDMKSSASLIRALQEYAGTLLFVSHDRSLINAVASHVFVMTGDGRAMLFEGQIDDYLRLASLANFPNVLDPEATVAGNTPAGSLREVTPAGGGAAATEARFRELKKQKQKLEKDISELDRRLAGHQRELDGIDADLLGLQGSAYEALAAAHAKRQQAAARQEDCESAWLAATEELEAVLNEISSLGRSIG